MTAMGRLRGFTLLEVLVAITLMAILSLIGWRGLDAVERTSERIFLHADDTLALIRVVGQIERDIRQHADIDILPPAPSRPAASAPSNVPAAQPPASALPPGIAAGNKELALVRAAGDGAWQRVRWRFEKGALHRAVGPASATLPLPDVANDDVVLEPVEDFSVRAWLSGRGWTAPPLPAATVATGLEVVVVRAGKTGAEPYRKVVLLP